MLAALLSLLLLLLPPSTSASVVSSSLSGNGKKNICKTGQHQSPLPLDCTVPRHGIPKLQFEADRLVVTASQFLITPGLLQFNFPGDLKSHLTVEHQTYFVQGVAIHSPSEHTIDGKAFAAEATVWLVDATRRKKAALSVLFAKVPGEIGSIFFDVILDTVLPKSTATVASLDPIASTPNVHSMLDMEKDLLPQDPNYYSYVGSQTVPPCKEDVEWFVMKQARGMSPAQLARLQTVIRVPSNARHVQPIGTRIVRATGFAYQAPGKVSISMPSLVQEEEHLERIHQPYAPLVVTRGRPIWNFAADAPPGVSNNWNYRNAHNWANLNPAYATCSTGNAQSPIDIQSDKTVPDLAPLTPAYSPFPLQIFQNGQTIIVPYPSSNKQHSQLVVDHKHFILDHIEFRRPAEHVLCTQQPGSLEVQLMFRNHDAWAGVSLSFVPGKNASTFLTPFETHLPVVGPKTSQAHKTYDKVKVKSIESLLPLENAFEYFAYEGSLTRAPCTEGVKWLVVRKQFPMSEAQLTAFTAAMPTPNNRKIQPLSSPVRLFKG